MKWGKWFEKWNMTAIKIKAPYLEMDWKPTEPDKDAAWELYVELLTRTATQQLGDQEGDEQAALISVYSLFPTTRTIIQKHGRGCIEFTKIAVVILNQIVRPFTAKWHKNSKQQGFNSDEVRFEFRKELTELQELLRIYTKMLADMAGVEDLTDLENE